MIGTQVRRHLPALGLILLAALAVRLLWIAFVHPDPLDGRFDDTVLYRGSAHFLAQGDGYLNPYTLTPTANWPPGYPAFLAGVFKLAGEGTAQTYAANAALGVATVAVVFLIGAIIFDGRAALIAAGGMALWPGQIYFTSLTLSEQLFTLLFSLGVLLTLLQARARSSSLLLLIALGALAGIAALTRGQGLLLLPIAVLTWRISGRRWRDALASAAVVAVVAGVVLAPWVIRNERELGSPVIIATNFGPNVWYGHHSGATGRSAPVPPPQPERGDLTQPEYEVAASNLALREALDYIVSHPTEEIRLAAAKVRAMYESDSTALDWNSGYGSSPAFSEEKDRFLRRLANGYWFAALILAGAGLVASRRLLHAEAAIVPLTVGIWTIGHLAFFGDARFHYPIVFAIALLSAQGALALHAAIWRAEASPRRGYARA